MAEINCEYPETIDLIYKKFLELSEER